MIRPAVPTDFEEIIAVSRLFYEEIKLDDVGYRFDEEQIRASYLKGLTEEDHRVLLYIEDCRILGLYFFNIRTETYYFKDRKYAAEIVWHSLPDLPPGKRLKVMLNLLDAALMFTDMEGVENSYLGLDARKEFYCPGINRAVMQRGFNHIVNQYHRRLP